MDGNTTGNLIRHSRPRRHKTYVGAGFLFNCHPFGDIYQNKEEACRFIRITESCNIIVHLIDYLDFMVCDINLNFIGMIIFTLFLVCFYCCIVFVTLKYFVVPNMLTMAHGIHMSGYTFGFLVMAAILVVPLCVEISVTCKGHFAYSALLVSDWVSVILPILTAGFITISASREVTFHLRPRLFCWNMLMVLFGLVTLFHVLSPDNEGKNSFNEYFYPILFGSIYFGYVAFLLKYQSQARPRNIKHRSPSIGSDEYDAQPAESQTDGDAWKVFLQTISPYSNNVGNFGYIIIITPIWLVLSFFVPVVTRNRHLNGWCKIINMINISIFPMVFYATPSEKLFYCIAFICLLVAVLIAVLTYVRRVPPFHKYLAIFGSIVGVYVFHFVDNELNCLFWQVLNYIVDWRADSVFLVSPVAIFITVAILIHALVDNDYTEIAYGMIMGTITLTIYASYPIIVFNLCFSRKHMTPITANIETTFDFMMITLIMLFLGVASTNFQIRKSHSYFLAIMYTVYYIFVFLSSLQLVHPFGSQHSIYWDHGTHADWA